MYNVDETLKAKLEQKINETLSESTQISDIVNSLDAISKNNKDFAYGIVIGRLYNSFHYQSRRILKRNPTQQEFTEFVKLLSSQQDKFLDKLSSL